MPGGVKEICCIWSKREFLPFSAALRLESRAVSSVGEIVH